MGKGMTAEEAMKEVKMVVEGVYSAKAAPWTCKEMQCSCTNCGSSEQSVI